MNQIAMYVGYLVIGLGAISAVAFLAGLACTYSYQKLLKDVPNWRYVQNAVAIYRETYPPDRWKREQMGDDE